MLGFKYLAISGSFLLWVGASIEPSIGVWVISIGGTLLAAALGRDKTFVGILFYIPIAMGWGIFGSQILHSMWPVPQIAAAFFTAMFGGEATWYIVRSCREGSFSDLIISVVSALTPFKSKK
jgi:hypothetical protein